MKKGRTGSGKYVVLLINRIECKLLKSKLRNKNNLNMLLVFNKLDYSLRFQIAAYTHIHITRVI